MEITLSFLSHTKNFSVLFFFPSIIEYQIP